MSIDPVERLNDFAEQNTERLRRITRSRLQRIQASGTAALNGPSLIVAGYSDVTSEIIGHGFAPAHDAIFGLRLAPRFDAVAAFARSVISSPDGRFRDGWCAVAVDRGGIATSLLAIDGGEPHQTSTPDGWLVDACRRAVGHRTAGQVEHPVHLFLALWLDRLLVELTASSRGLRWSDAVALAPAPGHRRSIDPSTVGTAIAGRTTSWSSLRAATALGGRLPVPVAPDHAAWMDTPMFARWCLGFFPDVSDLRNDIGFLATAELAAQVEQTISAALTAADSQAR